MCFTHTILTKTNIASILVISPVNTIHNWNQEFTRWSAQLCSFRPTPFLRFSYHFFIP